jgi:hypothetical protein
MLRLPVSDRAPWELLHPALCHEHEYTCPFTHAVTSTAPTARPGQAGVYLVRLDSFGRLRIDGRAPFADTRALISTSLQARDMKSMEAVRG